MALDPRTPVFVGVGHVTNLPGPGIALEERSEPVDLVVKALRAAAEDCGAAPPGRPARAGDPHRRPA